MPARAHEDEKQPDELFLYDYFDLQAAIPEFTSWLESYVTTELGHNCLLAIDGSRLTSSVDEYIAEHRAHDIDSIGFMIRKEDDPWGRRARLGIQATPLSIDTINIFLFSAAQSAYDTYFFFYIRDVIREAYTGRASPPRSHNGSKRGPPHMVGPEQRLRIVQEWRIAKAEGKTKKHFADSILPPNQVEPGISTKTITRWEKEFPEE